MEAEMALLGSIMLRPDAIYDVLDTVTPTSFYFEKHKTIFETMLELFGKNQPIDILSLSSRLKEKDLLAHDCKPIVKWGQKKLKDDQNWADSSCIALYKVRINKGRVNEK